MWLADVREEGMGGGFGGAEIGQQRPGVRGEGFVLGQRFQPEHARQTGGLQLGEHGLPDDR